MTLTIRPHHLIDILCDHAKGRNFTPHEYGHSEHIVANKIISDIDQTIKLTDKEDDICAGCSHLMPEGFCDDVLSQLTPPISKHEYNNRLDNTLFEYLNLKPGTKISIRSFLKKISAIIPGIEQICSHPGEDKQQRLTNLQKVKAELM